MVINILPNGRHRRLKAIIRPPFTPRSCTVLVRRWYAGFRIMSPGDGATFVLEATKLGDTHSNTAAVDSPIELRNGQERNERSKRTSTTRISTEHPMKQPHRLAGRHSGQA